MEHHSLENVFSYADIVAGGGAGFAEHFFMFPFDTVKTRLQSGNAHRLIGAFRSILVEERFAHLYRGCIPVLASAVPAHAAYFGVYEASKRLLGENSAGVAGSAICATVAHDSISTPFDVVKQRMQMDVNRSFSSSINCAKNIIRKDGAIILFRSLPTTLVMNIPHFLTYWLIYETSLSQLSGDGVRHHESEYSLDYLIAGSLAGGCASVISFPLDTIKTHQQLSLGTSIKSTVKDIITARGIRGLFKGVTARVLHTSCSGAIMMVTYENLKKKLEPFN